MIPKIITRHHVERALKQIRADGVPAGRDSSRYHVVVGGKRVAPKYVVSLANLFANGLVLAPASFSGGGETNNFLTALGYVIEDGATGAESVPRTPRAAPRVAARAEAPRLATVLLECNTRYDGSRRMSALAQVTETVASQVAGPIVASFSGGWFKADGGSTARGLDKLVPAVRRALHAADGRVAVTVGIDGREDRDQLAAAITTDGIVALGRKFHPTRNERDFIDAAPDAICGEGACERIASLFGRSIYLAVCYDGFGIKAQPKPRQRIDAVVDHIHSFGARGSGIGSGDVLFARHGLAGASQSWKVPVFGTVRFVDRMVPPEWPSGVIWTGPRGSTMQWSYARNPLRPEKEIVLATQAGRAVVRVFPPLAAAA